MDIGEDMQFIHAQGVEIGSGFGSAAKIGFWIVGFLVLLTTELGLMDMVARVTADLVRTLWARDSKRWTLQRLYYVFLWVEILLGCAILLGGFDRPLTLLVLSACLNGLVMAFYASLLLWMNNRILPGWLAMGKVRFVAIIWACAFYGYFAVRVLADNLPRLWR